MKTYFCVICKCDVTIRDSHHMRLKHNLTNKEYVEIKGDHLLSSPSCKISIEKEKCIREHAKILTSDDVKPFLDYVEEKYGKNYYKKFRYEK